MNSAISKTIINDKKSESIYLINEIKIKNKSNSSHSILYPAIANKTLANSWPDANHDDTIFALIGTGRMVGTNEPAQLRNGDLMASLYDRYCRALDDPQSALEGDWIAPSARPTASHQVPDLTSQQQAASVDALLSGAQRVEQAFGKLEGDPCATVAVESAPDILRLFAPPEFRAQSSRLPPALVRREHHATSIDSALLMPNVLADPARSHD
ncbi:MAG: hypothetical protein QOC89_591 [Paraburkholderia sp.]|uniref:TagK domain-containing protein n=1 Tax=Paraburkholderia sp. TaxID=1926495 RepID=UPI002AFE4FDC|nr:TagK domain-containing protein [Paraburkholderia sp.]MEA3082894.1 hypothetical protein [Paraburkholderia sp.]